MRAFKSLAANPLFEFLVVTLVTGAVALMMGRLVAALVGRAPLMAAALTVTVPLALAALLRVHGHLYMLHIREVVQDQNRQSAIQRVMRKMHTVALVIALIAVAVAFVIESNGQQRQESQARQVASDALWLAGMASQAALVKHLPDGDITSFVVTSGILAPSFAPKSPLWTSVDASGRTITNAWGGTVKVISHGINATIEVSEAPAYVCDWTRELDVIRCI